MKFYHLMVSSLLVLSITSCNNASHDKLTDSAKAIEQAKAPTKAVLGSYGIATENIDSSVKPGDNFFKYVNGIWLKNTEIPADRSRYGSFSILRDKSEIRVREIIENAASKSDPSVDEKRIGDFYNAYLDQTTIEAKGIMPLKDDLNKIQRAKTHNDIAALMMDIEMGLDTPISPFVYIDAKDNEKYIVYMTQSGLGLPNRNYYFDESEKGKGLLESYIGYLATMLTEAGVQDAKERAENVLGFETALAEGHWEPVKRRNRDLIYNKMNRDNLKTLAPGMPWDQIFESTGLGNQDTIIVREKSAIVNAAEVFEATPIGVLKDYLTISLISNHADYLPARIDNAKFDFFGRTLRGQEEQRPRWKRATTAINGSLGEVVGKVYVKTYFPPESKIQMIDLVENLRKAFKDGIDNLEWMGEDTKKQAQYKLRKFNPKIGYPDQWELYQGLEINPKDLIGTAKNVRVWEWKDNIGQLGKPIDREDWGMTPQTVNAYYNSILNEIVFPAAILDAPFFDPHADAAVNYGGIGAVIGHEMGHGFDDQGRKSDGDGIQRDWWTEADAKKYTARADSLATQYSEFEPLPGENLNGKLGLGENIGDLTGVTMAYEAYKRSLKGKKAPVIDGITGDQRFFMAWAQVWAIKWKDEALSTQIKNGPHSPGEFRANGIVRNFDPWYEAFDVQPGDALYLPPEKRVKIW